MKKLKSLELPLREVKPGKFVIVRDGSEYDEIRTFQVIGYDSYYQEYLFQITEDIMGYVISRFHIANYDVDKKFLGKKFNTYAYRTN